MYEHLQNSNNITNKQLKILHTSNKGRKNNSKTIEINAINKNLQFITLNEHLDLYSSPTGRKTQTRGV